MQQRAAPGPLAVSAQNDTREQLQKAPQITVNGRRYAIPNGIVLGRSELARKDGEHARAISRQALQIGKMRPQDNKVQVVSLQRFGRVVITDDAGTELYSLAEGGSQFLPHGSYQVHILTSGSDVFVGLEIPAKERPDLLDVRPDDDELTRPHWTIDRHKPWTYVAVLCAIAVQAGEHAETKLKTRQIVRVLGLLYTSMLARREKDVSVYLRGGQGGEGWSENTIKPALQSVIDNAHPGDAVPGDNPAEPIGIWMLKTSQAHSETYRAMAASLLKELALHLSAAEAKTHAEMRENRSSSPRCEVCVPESVMVRFGKDATGTQIWICPVTRWASLLREVERLLRDVFADDDKWSETLP